jgi:hypothetical protein
MAGLDVIKGWPSRAQGGGHDAGSALRGRSLPVTVLEAGATSVADRLHRAPVQLDKALDDGQPQPQPAGDVGGTPDEHLEHPRPQLGRQPLAGVLDAQHHLAPLASHRDGDLASRLGIFRRIGEEVRHHLAQSEVVAIQHQPSGRHSQHQAMVPFLEQRSGPAMPVRNAGSRPPKRWGHGWRPICWGREASTAVVVDLHRPAIGCSPCRWCSSAPCLTPPPNRACRRRPGDRRRPAGSRRS